MAKRKTRLSGKSKKQVIKKLKKAHRKLNKDLRKLDKLTAPKNMFYDKGFVDTLKANTPFGAVSEIKPLPKPGDPGWVNYNVKFTSTLRPNAPHVFTQADVFKALEAFGNDVIDLVDASISNDRQRKAFKKFISASYERGIIHAKQLGRKDGITLFRYEDITPALKNTEDSNANLHTS